MHKRHADVYLLKTGPMESFGHPVKSRVRDAEKRCRMVLHYRETGHAPPGKNPGHAGVIDCGRRSGRPFGRFARMIIPLSGIRFGWCMKSTQYYRNIIDSLGQVPVDADRIRVLFSAKEYKAEVLNLIEKAERRIYIVALYLQDDAAGREILEALYLAKQKKPELDIKVFIDFHRAQRALIGEEGQPGNVGMYRAMSSRYEHQIDILGVPVKGRELFGVLHLKGSVFDDQVFYTGASLNNVYLHQEDKYRCDRYHILQDPVLAEIMTDYLFRYIVASPAVQPLDREEIPTAKQLKISIRHFKKNLRKARYDYPHVPPVDGQVGITPLAGFGRRHNSLNKTIHHLMRSAESHVMLLTPYFNLPGVLAREIKALLRRNIKVSIVTGDKVANDFYISPGEPFNKIGALPYIYEINLRRFAKTHRKAVEAGRLNLHLWSHDAHTFHLKGLYCDDRYKIITGNNLNPRAWRLDLENGLLIHDHNRNLERIVKEEMDQIFTNTTRLGSHEEIEDIPDYPLEVRKVLSRVRKSKFDILLKKLL